MKVLVFFVVLCALIGVNRAHFEKNYGEIDGHDHIGTKKAYVEVDPGSETGMIFLFPQRDANRTHVITGFRKVDETDYEPKFDVLSGGIGFTEIKIRITSDKNKNTILTTFDFYGDRV